MKMNVMTTRKIRSILKKEKKYLYKDLKCLYKMAFPKMSMKDHLIYIKDYFTDPGKNFSRVALLFRNENNDLISAAVMDKKKVSYKKKKGSGIYSISRAVHPSYQGKGIGKKIAAFIFSRYNPFILFTTCAQSASLYSWLHLRNSEFLKGYDFLPSITADGERVHVSEVPEGEFHAIIELFKKLYGGVAKCQNRKFTHISENLTSNMVRRGIYSSLYRFHPWKKDGREDEIAKALKLTPRDGVLLFFRQKGE